MPNMQRVAVIMSAKAVNHSAPWTRYEMLRDLYAASASEISMSPSALRRLCRSLLCMLPIPALAQSAFTVQAVNVRAGPDRVFPLVSWLPGGTPVNVIGCTNGWRWCDVIARGTRGWVYSRYLYEFCSAAARRSSPSPSDLIGARTIADVRGTPIDRAWNNWGSPSWRPPPPPPPRRPPPRPSPPPTARSADHRRTTARRAQGLRQRQAVDG